MYIKKILILIILIFCLLSESINVLALSHPEADFPRIPDNMNFEWYIQFEVYDTSYKQNITLKNMYSNDIYIVYESTYNRYKVVSRVNNKIYTYNSGYEENFGYYPEYDAFTGNPTPIWITSSGQTLGYFSANDIDNIICNFDIKDNNGNVIIPINLQPYSDYYIEDELSLLSETEINNFHNLEKKYEYNLKSQFFIRLRNEESVNTNEENNIKQYGDTKSESGRGTFVLDVIKLNNGNYRLGLALSGNFLKQIPQKEHYQIIYSKVLPRINKSCNYSNIYLMLVDIYESILWDNPQIEKDVYLSDFNTKWMRDRVNEAVPITYNLKFGKIEKETKEYLIDYVSFSNVNLDDRYGIVDNNDYIPDGHIVPYVQHYNFPCENCDNHIWYINLENPISTQTPIPTMTPTPIPEPEGTGNLPTQKPKSTIPPAPTGTSYPGLDVNPDDFINDLDNQINPPTLTNSYKKLLNLNTSRGQPPVIAVNLKTLFNASMSNVAPGTNNPFNDENTPVLDFGDLNTKFVYQGMGIIDYLRMIIGFAMIFITLKHIYDKINGGAVLD